MPRQESSRGEEGCRGVGTSWPFHGWEEMAIILIFKEYSGGGKKKEGEVENGTCY